MTVVPIKSAELGRWRLAINPAVSRLWFTVDHAGPQPQLVVEVRETHSETEVDLAIVRALIELDREFSRESAGRAPDAPVLIAVALRDRLLDLFAQSAMSEETLRARSRERLLDPFDMAQAYRDALGAVLRAIVEGDGPDAVRMLAKRGG
jgi:hypothetical protein